MIPDSRTGSSAYAEARRQLARCRLRSCACRSSTIRSCSSTGESRDIPRGCGGTSCGSAAAPRCRSRPRRWVSRCRVGDQRQFAEHGAGAGMADVDALAVALAVEHDLARAPRHRPNRRRRSSRRASCRPAASCASAPKASNRSCSCVKPSKSLTPDRMRMSSSSAMASPVRERSVQAADESARIARKSTRWACQQFVTNGLCRPAWRSPEMRSHPPQISQGTSLYPPLSVTRISALEGSRSIFWRKR